MRKKIQKTQKTQKVKKVQSAKQVKPGRKKNGYKRAIQIIIELNEKIVDDADDEDDPLWDELAQIRKQLPADESESEVIGRLVQSLVVGGKDIDIDEASPGSDD